MREYQWMFLISIIFCSIGGYVLSDNIIAGTLLVIMGFSVLLYKWKLQYAVREKDNNVGVNE